MTICAEAQHVGVADSTNPHMLPTFAVHGIMVQQLLPSFLVLVHRFKRR